MKYKRLAIGMATGTGLMATAMATPVYASSHMDAPLITLDNPANTTDVYAFRSESEDGATQYLTTALAVYPFEEPGIGPNNYRFDDNVLYEIHVALGEDIFTGEATFSYQFQFGTTYANDSTILQSYLGVIDSNCDGDFNENRNLMQTYTVTKVDHTTGGETVLGENVMVPPNNQGFVTPCYNQNDDGNRPAREGVSSEADLDAYTSEANTGLEDDYRVFAGQRDDGFYADIQSIFDLDFSFGADKGSPPRGLPFAVKPFDSQGGFNVHTIVLNIPLDELDGAEFAGVYATTSRRQMTVLSIEPQVNVVGGALENIDEIEDEFVQVGRQGNPLFVEALIAIVEKDLYNRTPPTRDAELFSEYAANPEIAALLGLTPLGSLVNAGKLLVEDIFIPDLIKVDLTTGPAPLAGESAFSRLSVFGGDVLESTAGGPFDLTALGLPNRVPGGFPNGRRFGDDVDDIALNALGFATTDLDGVTENDITFNDVFPYAATPQNGRNHGHHAEFF